MKNEKKVVLFVDDSLLILERMILVLEEAANIEFVVHAGTYKEALETLEVLGPQLVLLDIDLPDGSGLDLLKFIRQKYTDIVVFIVTNHATDQYREACRRLGASRFFDKSCEFDAVAASLNEYV